MGERYFRAAELYSHPATGNRPAKAGVLPIKRSAFYSMLKSGGFPKPDAIIGGTRLWSAELVRSAVMNINDEQPKES